VVAAAVFYAQPEGGHLGAVDVHAGRAVLAAGVEAVVGDAVDEGLFEQVHHLAHLEAAAVEVEQQVAHHLAGAVVGDLAAAVDLDQRDVGDVEQVLGLAGLAQGTPAGARPATARRAWRRRAGW
jgi:hypothetical protein